MASDKAYDVEARLNALYGMLATTAKSEQVNPGSWNSNGSWVDFSSGNWPTLSFTVPVSGSVWVSVTAGIWSGGTTNVDAFIGWKITGTDSVPYAAGHGVGIISGPGTGNRSTTRRLITGLTPGGSDTLTPGWFRNNAVGVSDTGDGQLAVEAAWL